MIEEVSTNIFHFYSALRFLHCVLLCFCPKNWTFQPFSEESPLVKLLKKDAYDGRLHAPANGRARKPHRHEESTHAPRQALLQLRYGRPASRIRVHPLPSLRNPTDSSQLRSPPLHQYSSMVPRARSGPDSHSRSAHVPHRPRDDRPDGCRPLHQ